MPLYITLIIYQFFMNSSSSSKFSTFNIVLVYALVSGVYIYTSDYFLQLFVSNIEFLSKIQTYKGLGFILITSVLLYVLVRNNLASIAANYQQMNSVRQASDEQIRKTKEEYMALFNHSPLPMWIFDIDTYQFLQVNDAACINYGYSHAEYLNMTLKDIRPKEDVLFMERLVAYSLKKKQFSFPDNIRHQKKNGEIIQVKIKNTVVTFNGKKARLASSVDVTTEVEIQNKLIETNLKLQSASEIAGLGYWTHDLINSKIEWSDELYKIFEIDPQKFKLNLNNIKALFHPDYQLNFDVNFNDFFEDSMVKESEQKIITGSGKIKWIQERLFLIRDENFNPIKIQGIALDITKRKLHEQEISESNERFKILSKATVEIIIDWDINNNKIIWGEGFKTILGYDINTMNKYLWSQNIHPNDRKRVLVELREALLDSTKENFNTEFRFLCANGKVSYMQHRGVFIRDENGKAVRAIGAMIDFTDTLEKMKKIELQNQVLKDIAWTQSHIVRAPLANLMGLIGLMKNNIKTGVSDKILIGYISDSADKLDNIIRDIVNKTENIQSE